GRGAARQAPRRRQLGARRGRGPNAIGGVLRPQPGLTRVPLRGALDGSDTRRVALRRHVTGVGSRPLERGPPGWRGRAVRARGLEFACRMLPDLSTGPGRPAHYTATGDARPGARAVRRPRAR